MPRTSRLAALTLSLVTVVTVATAKDAPPVFRVPVTTVATAATTVRWTTRVQGIVEAIETPRIMSKVAAEIVEILVDEGDPVTAGQILARLDDEGFRLDRQAAKADIGRWQSVLENAQARLTRDEALFQRHLAPGSRLDDDRAAVKQARAQLAVARSQLAKAEYALSHTRIVSPIAGIVQSRTVSIGDYVNPNSPSSRTLFEIVDTSRLRARLYFPEGLADVVAVGMPVEIVSGRRRSKSRIAILRPMLEPGNHARHALADLPADGSWRAGEAVTAIAELARHEGAITIPAAAIVERPAGKVVYRIEKGIAHEVAIATGIRDNGRVEIVSGLATGDTIALDGASYLSDGAAVTVAEARP